MRRRVAHCSNLGCRSDLNVSIWHVSAASIDFPAGSQNNLCMTRPETVRRGKSYSSANGYVYQYYFYEVLHTRRGPIEGTEYVYMVSADRKKAFPLRIFVRHDAEQKW